MFFRNVVESDRGTLDAWIAADPYHRDSFTPDFWISPAPGTVSCAIEDDAGTVLFLRQDVEGTALRLYVQFPPEGRLRIARAVVGMVGAVGEWARGKGFDALVYDSRSPQLIKFCERLGFKAEHRKRL